MKKIAGILKLLLVVSLLIGSIGSDVVLADSFETNSINVVGAKASNQIELGTIGAWFDSVPMMSASASEFPDVVRSAYNMAMIGRKGV